MISCCGLCHSIRTEAFRPAPGRYDTTPVERSFMPSWELYFSIVRPARRDFRLALFFSNLFRTELTRPALWPFAVVGETVMKADKIKPTIKPRDKNLFIDTP